MRERRTAATRIAPATAVATLMPATTLGDNCLSLDGIAPSSSADTAVATGEVGTSTLLLLDVMVFVLVLKILVELTAKVGTSAGIESLVEVATALGD